MTCEAATFVPVARPRLRGAVLRERTAGGMFQVSGWPGSFEGSATPLLRALGFGGLGDFRTAQVSGTGDPGSGDSEAGPDGKGTGGVSFRIGPERVLVCLGEAEAFWRAAAGLDLSLSPVLDLTASRRIFRISDEGSGAGPGPGSESGAGGSGSGSAAELLSRLAAVDFSEEEFPAGRFAQAECLGTGMLFHRAGAGDYDVYVSRSWGDSFRDWAQAAGAG